MAFAREGQRNVALVRYAADEAGSIEWKVPYHSLFDPPDHGFSTWIPGCASSTDFSQVDIGCF